MSTEQYANSAQTKLDGAINDMVTTLTVLSAVGFPPTPQFRIRIDSELLLVTNLSGSGNKTWTVIREYEDAARFPKAAHSDQADIVQVLTAGGLENLLPLTSKGDLLVQNGTDNVRLGVGTNGQVLTADSAETTGLKWAASSGGAPADADYLVKTASGGLSAERVVTDTTGTTGITWDWGTSGQAKANATHAGKWVKLASATASSSATVDFTGLSSAYVAYKVVLSHVAPATDAVVLWMRTSSDGGTTYDSGASDYGWAQFFVNDGAATNTNADTADSEYQVHGSNPNIGNATGEYLSGILTILNPSAAKYGQFYFDGCVVAANGSLCRTISAGRRLAAADIDAIRLMMSSGNIASGQFDLFGLSA